MKVQEIIRYKSKEQMFNLLTQLVDQYYDNKDVQLRKAGITAKGILKYLIKIIQPTSYLVQILSQSVNKIVYIKLLKFYKLDPKDFVKQDPDSLYEESVKKGLLKSAKKVSLEKFDLVKQGELAKKNEFLERQRRKVKILRHLYYRLKNSVRKLEN
jgi:hypothetical protein